MMGLFNFFASYSQKELKKINALVAKINAFEPEMKKLNDQELRAKTDEFKSRLAAGETLDDIHCEAFAAVREAAFRVIGQRAFDTQLIGGTVLHQGRIAEMKTGEGKTLSAVFPSYLNALSGKGVHVVTVNDYLARRDSEWMGKVHRFMGLTVGLIAHDIEPEERKKAYLCDITYGTNNEFGFDYLRDNMVKYKEQMVQRGHNFEIVDEVDSILIDEARTPLIISGHGEESDEMYAKASAFVARLKQFKIKEMESKESYDDVDADYVVEEKHKNAVLTNKGMEKAQRAFGVENWADPSNVETQHYVNQALKAWGTMQRDIDYVVKDGEVIIVDEFTGRLMYGRRYSNGLHQSIEAKEGVKIENESKTLATITFQNYFRIYTKLSGMTGTAMTEEDEFNDIYNLDVIEIPTNLPMVRKDHNDVIYKTEAGKYASVVRQIRECHEKGQPVLVGTTTIEKSELISKILKREGIAHTVLNAKYHDKEAMIVAQAGKKGAVTISTNMAGRGTDIILGGNAEYMAKSQMQKEGFEHEYIAAATGFTETDDEKILAAKARYQELYAQFKPETEKEAAEVKAAGGLFILGTERHESRRIDNQLRGRAGRQGDVGESRFYLSLEDELMRLFGGDRVASIAEMLNIPEDQPIDAKILSNTIENAQKKVESNNFQRRKRTLEYDDVINQQREIIYDQRRKVLNGEDLRSYILKMGEDVLENAAAQCLADDIPDNWDFEGLHERFDGLLLTKDDLNFTPADFDTLKKKDITDLLAERLKIAYERSETENTPERMREIERYVLLGTVDKHWMEHIDAMDDLRQGVSLRSYGNRNPLTEYKFESFDMFDEMVNQIKFDTVRDCLRLRFIRREIKRESNIKIDEARAANSGEKPRPIVKKASQKVGRNDPCPCGSGKKYKQCCGANNGSDTNA
ncbi:MAG: preprotein translocase subunit SecA [Clostridia bacterium]|nr:preprotein translocase subunit SecA [Clostridia bacterium]